MTAAMNTNLGISPGSGSTSNNHNRGGIDGGSDVAPTASGMVISTVSPVNDGGTIFTHAQ